MTHARTHIHTCTANTFTAYAGFRFFFSFSLKLCVQVDNLQCLSIVGTSAFLQGDWLTIVEKKCPKLQVCVQ